MKWILTFVLAIALAGCAHSSKVSDSALSESINNVRAAEIGMKTAQGLGWSERLFTTAEQTTDGWRVFVEEATGRKRKAFVLLNKRGDVVGFRQVS
jgi:hypothetical protein